MSRIEQELERRAGINAAVEETAGTIVLSGLVDSAEARQAAEDIVAELAPPGTRIDNDLEVEQTLPVGTSSFYAGSAPSATTPDTVEEIRAADAEIEPDFTDQQLSTSGLEMAGVNRSDEADTEFFAPTDPVITSDARGEVEVLGGFNPDSMSNDAVNRSVSDGQIGDGALEDAVRRELLEDAATTALPLDVQAVNGVVYLRGEVEDVDDSDSAVEVASRVRGVREVIDETRVRNV